MNADRRDSSSSSSNDDDGAMKHAKREKRKSKQGIYIKDEYLIN
jgi:hypothetical protein